MHKDTDKTTRTPHNPVENGQRHMQALLGQPMDTDGEAVSLAARRVETGDTTTDHVDVKTFKQQTPPVWARFHTNLNSFIPLGRVKTSAIILEDWII